MNLILALISGLGLGLGLETSGLGLGLGLETPGLVNIPGKEPSRSEKNHGIVVFLK